MTSNKTDTAGLSPTEARARFRAGLRVPTAGWSSGFTQANLITVPRDLAYDVLLFAQRNPKPCPVLDVLDSGAVSGRLLDGDIRTDIPRYRVFVDGELVDEPTDVTAWWRDDLVSVLVGCSFTFEQALLDENVPVRHIAQGVNVPMYRTTQRCRPAGAMSGPLVVSMRPMPASRVADAVRVTSRYPAVHGAPVHIGDPTALGIKDLANPDYGDAVHLEPGEVPVFWACGVTPQAAVVESRPSLAITHSPGYMLITDARNTAYQVP